MPTNSFPTDVDQSLESKYEHGKFLIERYDHYYDTVNSKGSFYIAINTFIFGGLCAGFIAISKQVSQGPLFWLLALVTFAMSITSIVLTIMAISPFVKDNQNNDDTKSLIFFGGIAQHNLNSYLNKVEVQSEDTICEDMYRQIHCLASGLKFKFKKLATVSYLLVGQFFALTILCIYIFVNYTP